MRNSLQLLMFASFIGAFDLFYFHIYRYRLYRQPSSVAEEWTHLARAAIFVAIVGLMVFGTHLPGVRLLILTAAALDLVNNGIDVMLERRSRKPLGGLPSGEYLLHIVITFLLGAAVATFWFADDVLPIAYESRELLQGAGALVMGTVLIAVEGTLFGRAIHARRAAHEAPAALAPAA